MSSRTVKQHDCLVGFRSIVYLRTVFGVAIFCYFNAVCFAADADQLEASSLLHSRDDRSLFLGKSYRYKVMIEDTVSPNHGLSRVAKPILNGERTLTIGWPSKNQTAIPISIVHHGVGIDEPHLSKSFDLYWEGFDGRETRTYNRTLISLQDERIDSAAFRSAGATLTLAVDDPFFISLFTLSNATARFIGQTPIERPETSIPLLIRRKEDAVLGTLIGVSEQSQDTTMWFTEGPEHHLVGGVTLSNSIDSTRRIDGVVYPESGYYRGELWSGGFRLLSVREIEKDFNSWFRKWPRGTVVADRIEDSVNRIEYNAAEIKSIREFRTQSISVIPRGGFQSFFVALNILLIFVAALVYVFRYRRAKTQ